MNIQYLKLPLQSSNWNKEMIWLQSFSVMLPYSAIFYRHWFLDIDGSLQTNFSLQHFDRHLVIFTGILREWAYAAMFRSPSCDLLQAYKEAYIGAIIMYSGLAVNPIRSSLL